MASHQYSPERKSNIAEILVKRLSQKKIEIHNKENISVSSLSEIKDNEKDINTKNFKGNENDKCFETNNNIHCMKSGKYSNVKSNNIGKNCFNKKKKSAKNFNNTNEHMNSYDLSSEFSNYDPNYILSENNKRLNDKNTSSLDSKPIQSFQSSERENNPNTNHNSNQINFIQKNQNQNRKIDKLLLNRISNNNHPVNNYTNNANPININQIGRAHV